MKILTLVVLTVAVAMAEDGTGDTTTIKGQVFCDNFCKVYFNGASVFEDTLTSRVVNEFEFEAPKSGTRTIALWLGDSSHGGDNHIRSVGGAPSQATYLDLDNDGINEYVNWWCLPGGGFKGVFKDDKCGDIIITNEDFQCQAINIAPSNLEDCFEYGFYSNPLYVPYIEKFDTDGVRYVLPDPCIANNGVINIEQSDECTTEYIQDFDMDWLNNGYDDSGDEWYNATIYPESEICPRGCIRPDEESCNGNSDQYCVYPTESWQNAQFIWTDDVYTHNIILCRYEYESNCGDSSEDSDD